MRVPSDVAARAPRARHRRRWLILAVVIVLVVILASLRTLATLYTDELWFGSVGLHSVWVTLFEVKVGLFASFGAIFFVLAWINLVVTDRLSAGATSSDPEDELVRRYRRAIRPYAGWLYAVLALVMALVAASGTIGEWQNWILFTHGVAFGVKDPLFGKDISFFVFKLPFLSFVVNWLLVSLAVVTVVVVIFHYLNGGIHLQRPAPRVGPSVKAHISVLLALIALVKAAGYLIARYQLVVSTNGYVEGAGYSDVHARLPALWLLFWVSLGAAAVLLWNIRRQGWTAPVLAVGVWGFVALVIGVIYPAVLQAVKVNPAQAALEKPYIERNIKATRAAYNIGPDNLTRSTFAASAVVTASTVRAYAETLRNLRLWDSDLTLPTFQKEQDLRTYYTISSLVTDRYVVDGRKSPVIVGVRQVSSSSLPADTWINEHLLYTHGEGMVVAPANQVTSSGTPIFAIRGVPPTSLAGYPTIRQPAVYFGVNQPGWVVADTKQAEIDYQTANGGNAESHYRGTGGVRLSSFLRRVAFAVRLGDFNLLVSNQVTSQSRIMFVRDIEDMAQKAAPFLSFDSQPYPVLVDGHIDWVLDAYTTTSQYPYSQNADTALVPPGSGLPSSYNYVRNSVAVVIDAYSGKMNFYALDTHDPILRTYEQAFPQLFTPWSKMPPTLLAHLRYPRDIFSIQAAMYGRYHISSPDNFYDQANAWKISPTPGIGSPSQALAVTTIRNAQGQVVSGPIERMQPIYQVQQLPGQPEQTFTVTEAYVPTSTSSQIQNLSAFIVGSSDPQSYGELHVYTVPNQNVIGPALVDSKIQADSAVSKQISLLNQNGSTVLLGNELMVPLDQSMLYVRPVYVTSNRNPFPVLQYVIAAFNGNVSMQPSADAAVSNVLGIPVGGTLPSSSGGAAPSLSPNSSTDAQIASYLSQATADYQKAQRALASRNLAAYQLDVDSMEQAVKQADLLAGGGNSSQNGSTAFEPSGQGQTKSTPSAPSTGGPTTGSTSVTTTTVAPSSTTSTSPHATTRQPSTTTTAKPGEAVGR